MAQQKLSDTVMSQLSVSDLSVTETDVRDQFKVTGKISNIGGKTEDAGTAQIGFVKSGENKVAEVRA